jgi:hypothetical protein
MNNSFTVTVTRETGYGFVKVVWPASAGTDITKADVTTINISDDEFDMIIAHKGHEGAKVPGFVVDLDW